MKYFFLFLLFYPLVAFTQIVDEESITKQYEYNIQQEFINEIYIPEDVADALKQLDLLSDEKGRAKLIEADENIAADRLVMGLGKWMIVNWNFYEGSRLSHKLRDYGVTHPDDMAKFLIVTYHRYLSQAPLELEERGQIYFDNRKKDQEKRNAAKKVITG